MLTLNDLFMLWGVIISAIIIALAIYHRLGGAAASRGERGPPGPPGPQGPMGPPGEPR